MTCICESSSGIRTILVDDMLDHLDDSNIDVLFKVINKIPSKLYLRRVFKNLEKFEKQLYQKYIRSHGIEGITWKDE